MASSLSQWLADAEKYLPQAMALEAGVPQTETVPAETSPVVDLGPVGKFQVSTPPVAVTIKKVG